MAGIGRWFSVIYVAGLITFIGINPCAAYAVQRNQTSTELSTNGAKLWANTCARCHNMRSIDEFRPDQWHVIMAHMRIRAQLTGQETREILMFLTKQTNEIESHGPAPSALQPTQKRIVKSGSAAAKREEFRNANEKKMALSKSSGRAIYQRNCAACHGADGKGAIPGVPDMTNPKGPLSEPYSVLLNNVIKGTGNMPPKGGNPNLSCYDLKAVLDYMLNAFNDSLKGASIN